MRHLPEVVIAATAADSGAVLPLMALIKSIAIYAPNTHLVVLSVGLSDHECTILARTAAGISLSICPFNAEMLQRATLQSRHVSRAAYARLFLAECLPELNRVIWLDADTLVLAGLGPLWSMDMGDALIAAVADEFIDPAEIVATASQMGAYVNSGVMVINLLRWRAEGVTQRCRVMMSSPNLMCEDQSVLNSICAGRVKVLECRWNFHASRFSQYPIARRYILPSILHYCGQRKPWFERTAFADLYRRHLPPEIRKNIRASEMSVFRRLELARRRLFGLLMGRHKYWAAVGLTLGELLLDGRLAWQRRGLRKDTVQMPTRAPLFDRGNDQPDTTAQRVFAAPQGKPTSFDQ